MLKSLVLFLLALAAFSADKPVYTDPALSTYTKSIEDIDLDATKKKREVRNKTVVALEVSIKKAMTAGDLDKAVWLKSEKERIAKEWVPSDAELIGDKPVKLEEMIVGKWKIVGRSDFFVFDSNGTWISPWPDFFGTWKLQNEKNLIMKSNREMKVFYSKNKIDIKANLEIQLLKAE